MKFSASHLNKLQTVFILVAVFALFVEGSCIQASNNSGHSSNQSARQQKQLQQFPVKEVSKSAVPPAVPAQPLSGATDEKVMLNPPHGQPGHRCEIPVGSPVNASPADAAQNVNAPSSLPAKTILNNPAAPTIANANRLNPSQKRTTAAPATGAKPANNPPHGQPWHRCNIPVGNPLP